jgi:hypothetical protein
MLPPRHHSLELSSALFVQKKQRLQRSDHQPIRNSLVTGYWHTAFPSLAKSPEENERETLRDPSRSKWQTVSFAEDHHPLSLLLIR